MKKITAYAKEHRKNPTKYEKEFKILLLKWKIRFRSQRQFDFYIVDFLIPDKRLAIEIDGNSHIGREEYDEKRTKYLESLGISIMRLKNEDIRVENYQEIKNKIKNYRTVDISKMDKRYVYGRAKY